VNAHYQLKDLRDLQHLVDGMAAISGSAESAEQQLAAYVLLAAGNRLSKVLIATKGTRTIIATASKPDSDWLPHGRTVMQTRRMVEGFRLLCGEGQCGGCDELCTLRLQGPYDLSQLFEQAIKVLVLP